MYCIVVVCVVVYVDLQQPSASEVVLSVVDMFGFERHEVSLAATHCLRYLSWSIHSMLTGTMLTPYWRIEAQTCNFTPVSWLL